MRAGTMRHRVLLQRRKTAQQASGELVSGWDDVEYRFAAAEPLGGRELFTAQQVGAKVTTRFRMRYVEIYPRDRIIWDGRAYDVQFVQQVRGLKHEIEILAEETVEEPVDG